MQGRVGGSTRDSLNLGDLREISIPIPPRNEQRRIIAKLDAVFEQIRAARDRLERLPALLNKLKRSILAAAFRGDLTKDWRAAHPDVEPAKVLLDRIRSERRRRREDGLRTKGKDPKKAAFEEPVPLGHDNLPVVPLSWSWARWDQVGDCQNGRAFPSSEYSATGTRLLRPGNLHVSGAVVWNDDNTRCMPDHWATDYPEHVIGEREVVINLTAQSLKDEFLGRCCMTAPGERALLNQRIGRLTPTFISPEFVLWLFKSPLVRQYIDELNSGSLIQHMFTSQIEKFALPIPPIEEQQVIVQRITDAMTELRAIGYAVVAASARMAAVERAALAKAFRGELVSQDPTDEPASILLDGICAARAAESERPRRRRGRRAGESAVDGTKPNGGHATNGHHDESLDLVVGMFQVDRRLTTTAIAEGTGLELSTVKKALKVLVDGGQVGTDRSDRTTTYVWAG